MSDKLYESVVSLLPCHFFCVVLRLKAFSVLFFHVTLYTQGLQIPTQEDNLVQVFVFNRQDCTVKTGCARKLGQSPICHAPRSSAHQGYFRQFLTRLVKNLTLQKDAQNPPGCLLKAIIGQFHFTELSYSKVHSKDME